MANEIHNYPLEIYRIGNQDYLDVDFFNGVGYDSAKILGLNAQSGKATMITDASVVTGTGEQTILNGTFKGGLSVPANFFEVGDSYRITLRGDIGAHNNDTLTIRVKANTIELVSSGAITLPTISTGKAFEFNMDFVIRAIGGATTASVMSSGSFTYNKDSANIFEGKNFHALNSTTFDTTIINTLDITAQFSSANVANTLMTHIAILEKTF